MKYISVSTDLILNRILLNQYQKLRNLIETLITMKYIGIFYNTKASFQDIYAPIKRQTITFFMLQ